MRNRIQEDKASLSNEQCSASPLSITAWTALLLASAYPVISHHPASRVNVYLVISTILALAAGLQIRFGRGFMTRKRLLLAGLVLAIFAVGQTSRWLRSMAPEPTFRGFDFSAYYLAAAVYAGPHGAELYQLPLTADKRAVLNADAPPTSREHAEALRLHVPFVAPFLYPPFVAVLLKPLLHLPFASAERAWEVLSWLFLLGSFGLVLELHRKSLDLLLLLILGVAIFSFAPLAEGLFFGQTGCFLLFLLTAGVWLLRKEQPCLSALCYALATMAKLTPAIAIPLLIFHRRWRWLLCYGGWIAVLLLWSITNAGAGWRAGWHSHERFLHGVLPAISCGVPVSANLSVVAWIQELCMGFVPHWPNAPASIPMYACLLSRATAAALYLGMLVRFYVRRRDADLGRDLVLMILLSLALSPITWVHHYTLALLPLLYLWFNNSTQGSLSLKLLWFLSATNLCGLLLLLIHLPILQLLLAGITPCLTISLVYLQLSRKRSAWGKMVAVDACEPESSFGEFAGGLPLTLPLHQ